MAKRRLRYPNDITTLDIPVESMETAKHETFRFLFNYGVWKGDLSYLCAICYIQGVLDGAQVAVGNKEISDAIQST